MMPCRWGPRGEWGRAWEGTFSKGCVNGTPEFPTRVSIPAQVSGCYTLNNCREWDFKGNEVGIQIDDDWESLKSNLSQDGQNCKKIRT